MSARNILLALPPSIVTAGLAVVAVMELAGSHPLTVGAPRTVAEAIVMHDGASAARLLEQNGNVDEIQMIRRGVFADRPVLATPLEAAILANETAMFEFLAARASTPSFERLACLASDVGARALIAKLGDASHCRAGAAWDAVFTRP